MSEAVVAASPRRKPRAGRGGELIGNGVALALVAGCLLMGRLAPDLYLRLAQEDEVLEWATFWSLALAGTLTILRLRERRARTAWFLLGLAAFCWFVALEEISWGQRLLGYRPPSYFLERNFQQELNLHNFARSSARKLALVAVLGGYGVVLPFLVVSRRGRRALRLVGAVPPPLTLVPVFAIALIAYLVYPLRMTGEWVELLLGLGLLLAACIAMAPRRARPRFVGLALLAVAAAALASAAWSLHLRSGAPAAVAAARAEVEILVRNVTPPGAVAGKVTHSRLRTHVEKAGGGGLLEGAASELSAVAGERAEHFLDPWNMPYWFKHRSEGDGSWTGLVYSFGPNRVRESLQWEAMGDDVGVSIRRTTAAVGAKPMPGSAEGLQAAKGGDDP